MIRFAAFAVCAFGLNIAQAFPIDVSRANLRVSNKTEFILENVILSNQPQAQWTRFQWNPQTNSFVLVDFAPMTPNPVGRWDLSFDIDCDGSPGRTSLTLNADNTCVSGENRPCRWMLNPQGEFNLEYLSGGKAVYTGRYSGGSLSGTFQSNEGRVRGCWKAMKVERLSFAPVTPDPRARRDSSGAPTP